MTALALDTREVALDLYSFLREIDPARWRDGLAEAARERLGEIEARLAGLVEAARPHEAALRARLEEILRIVRAYVPTFEGSADLRSRWMALRVELQPAYENLAAGLREWDVHVPSLRPTNYTRNVFHVLSALLVVALVEWFLDTPARMRGVSFAFAALGWTLEGTRRLSGPWNEVLMKLFGPVAHPHERHRVNSATWYVTALFVLSATGSALVGAVAVAVLGLADPAAAVIGRRYGRVKLLNGRTLEGSLAFVAAGAVAAFATIRVFHPDLALAASLFVAVAAAVAGAIAEVLARRVDDNLAVPVAAGGAAWITVALLGA